ncbi:DUF397 domain-containing protein [Streptomyces sp. NE5-10]|uniref:DUF397 domain-containing protein n=1 Tax=Streptomyces sp. NE5-10 TaxID=2759674 RepID=UPI001F5B3F24|nr:DUF397 domain-containing protein [Streptomyces sp. NE5-10]
MSSVEWRKSSFSGNTGGECIECAPLGSASWRKSSYSGNTGGDCVEVAGLTASVAVRDSKDTARPHFRVAPAAFAVFVEAAARGRV